MNTENKMKNYALDDYKEDSFFINREGFFIKEIKKVIQKIDKLSEDAVDNIINNAVESLNDIPNPLIEGKNFGPVGLLIGKIQSGKTLNFNVLLALAFDNNFKIGIIFGGTNTNLLAQNFQRSLRYFESLRELGKLSIYNTNDTDLNINNLITDLNNGKKILIIALKYPHDSFKKVCEKHMKKISSLFDRNMLKMTPTIIIDDEGDQATPNSKQFKKEESKTYEKMKKIRQKIEKHCFFSVTATPEGNIVQKVVDVISPDFCQLIEPGEGYKGLDDFHGANQDKYIKIISEEFAQMIESNINENEFLIEPMATFFVGNAIRILRNDTGVHTMLFHNSQLTDRHEIVELKVKDLLNSWQEIVQNGKNDPSYIVLRKHLVKAYDDFVRDGVKLKSFDVLEDTIIKCIKKCRQPFVINTENSDKTKFFEENTDKTRIVIGGEMLARGVTVKGLAATYISRSAKGKSNNDTIKQRARWLGYNANFFDICRVWMTKETKEDFSNLNKDEKELWDDIKNFNKFGESFKNFPRWISNRGRNNITRRTISNDTKISINDWVFQEYFIDLEGAYENNKRSFDFFANSIMEKCIDIDYGASNKHKLCRDINTEEFINSFFNKIIFHEKEEINIKIRKILENTKKIDVALLRFEKEPSKRTISANKKIKAPWTGNLEDKGVIGDREMPKKQGLKNVLIQILFLKAKSEEAVEWKNNTIVFGMYVPKENVKQYSKSAKE